MDESTEGTEVVTSQSGNGAKEHKKQLQRLKEKDPEFYKFLQEHDKELLEFDDEDIDEDTETEVDGVEPPDLGEDTDADTDTNFDDVKPELKKANAGPVHRKVITSEMVDIWCSEIKEDGKLSAVRSLLRAFRSACHHGDDNENESPESLSIVSSTVFNKIMLFVLNEMDGVLRGLLKFPSSGGTRETVKGLTTTSYWKKYGTLMRVYLGNALHVLNQMTDEQMVAFTLKRIKDSAVFLAAFPALLRKYLKVVLHFWGVGGGALQVVSFFFLRGLCIRLGSDCFETCLKGIYKAYNIVCKIKGKYASVSKLQQLRFLENCVTEIYGVDLASAYQYAFVFIRQLATVLRNALSEKPKGKKEDDSKGKKDKKRKKKNEVESTKNKKEAYLKVYDWQFINCIELWTNVICTYSSDTNFKHLAYPLSQIIFGVARLVPTARYLPIRLQCAKMLSRLGASTGTYIPVSSLLLDVFDMKELTNPPTGGVGTALDMFTRKLVGKPTLNTRAFQEACIFSVIEQLAEHLSTWSYSVAFFELSFHILIRLRAFCKTSRIDLHRKEIKELIRQIEINSEFTNASRANVHFSSSNISPSSFLKVEKESGSSPLSQFATEYKKKSKQRSNSIFKSSVLVGAKSSKFGSNLHKSEKDEDDDVDDQEDGDSEEGTTVFSTSWLPNAKGGLVKSKQSKEQKQTKTKHGSDVAMDEDVVEDLVLSSDDDEPASEVSFSEEEEDVSVKSSSGGDSKRQKPSPASEKNEELPSGAEKKKKRKWHPPKRKTKKKVKGCS